jgi:hypothetical protein|uniref:hypothetical protein n=2 Tax=Algoriphagus sp. TaxID=1872435 RepID=UPI0040487BFA
MKSPIKSRTDFEIEKKDTPLNQGQNFVFLPELWENSVSVFENAFSVTPIGELRLIDLLECLRDEDSWESLGSPRILATLKKAKINGAKISKEEDHAKRQDLKTWIPSFTPRGTVVTRDKDTKDKSFVPSGWMQIDIDGKDNPTYSALELKQKMSSWPFVGFCCYSISGKGVWGLAPTNNDVTATFNAIYQFAKSEGVNLDISKGKGEAELRIISFDHNPYINLNPTFIEPLPPEPIPIPKIKRTYHPVSSTSKDRVIKSLLDQLNAASEGSRHLQRLKVGRLAGGYVAGGLFSEAEIITLLSDDYTMHFPYDSPATQKKEIKAIEDGIKYGLGNPICLMEEAFAIPFDKIEFTGSQLEITQGKAVYLIDSEAILERKPDFLYIKETTYFALEPRPKRLKHLTKKISPP